MFTFVRKIPFHNLYIYKTNLKLSRSIHAHARMPNTQTMFVYKLLTKNDQPIKWCLWRRLLRAHLLICMTKAYRKIRTYIIYFIPTDVSIHTNTDKYIHTRVGCTLLGPAHFIVSILYANKMCVYLFSFICVVPWRNHFRQL